MEQIDSLYETDPPHDQIFKSSIGGVIQIPHEWLSPGVNEFMIRFDGPLAPPVMPSSFLVLTYQRISVDPAAPGVSPAEMTRVPVVIRSLEAIMSVYSAHSDGSLKSVTGSDFSPKEDFELLPPFEAPPTDATDLTVLVHGFNVTDTVATNEFFPRYLKRLYWTRHPILREQATATSIPWVVGVTWPGNQGGVLPLSELTFFPDDEFHAFQTGVALSRLLKELKQGTRKVGVVAHSLGNLVTDHGKNLSVLAVEAKTALIIRRVLHVRNPPVEQMNDRPQCQQGSPHAH